MRPEALDLLLGDDPDAILAYADSIRSSDTLTAELLTKLADCYRNFSDFEVPRGPDAINDEANRLMRVIKVASVWAALSRTSQAQFSGDVTFNEARRLARYVFIFKRALPGRDGEDLFNQLLEHERKFHDV